jgi:hypothetical protein
LVETYNGNSSGPQRGHHSPRTRGVDDDFDGISGNSNSPSDFDSVSRLIQSKKLMSRRIDRQKLVGLWMNSQVIDLFGQSDFIQDLQSIAIDDRNRTDPVSDQNPIFVSSDRNWSADSRLMLQLLSSGALDSRLNATGHDTNRQKAIQDGPISNQRSCFRNEI